MSDFGKVFELVLANSSFHRKEEQLVTFWGMVAKTQIDYLLLRKCDESMCMDCKVIQSETLSTQHRLLVMDLGVKRNRKKKRKKRFVCGKPKINWEPGLKTKLRSWRIS